MCGFAGYVTPNGTGSNTEHTTLLRAMGRALEHRGPDDSGTWCDPTFGVGLAHRRLSILDVTCNGHQPMHSSCGRFVLSYNGEIYNHREIRTQIPHRPGVDDPLRGESDTRTLLEAISAWGVDEAIARTNGMFAFAVWDRKEKSLWLARDRLGIKPLYWGHLNGGIIFGSQLSSLEQHPEWNPQLNRSALAEFLRRGYVPAPSCIYEDTFKLPAGQTLQWSRDTGPVLRPYWRLADIVHRGRSDPFIGTITEAKLELRRLLTCAVDRRLLSDVPLGAFLSGGVDSSTVVALMQQMRPDPVRTFTIGFQENSFNEAPRARAIAKHLGTTHTEFHVTATDALALVDTLADTFDEPFADSSQIPTMLLSRLTRDSVTVALSGDGGDELFGGYSAYARASSLWSQIRRLPIPMRVGFSRVLQRLIRSNRKRGSRRNRRLVRALGIAAARGPESLYARLTTRWDAASELLVEPPAAMPDNGRRPNTASFEEWMQFDDTMRYLPDDILTKVDRSTMAYSLEARTPLLDHEVVEFSWRLPSKWKYANGHGKLLLKQIQADLIPSTLLEAKKQGFGVPIGDWLRGPLRPWAEELLDPLRLKRDGLLRANAVQNRWRAHLAGSTDDSATLWTCLMFLSWASTRRYSF